MKLVQRLARLAVLPAVAFGFAAFVPASADAQTVELAQVPGDSVAIHYYRADGAYDGWGVHLWESFEKIQDGKVVGPREKSDMPLSGIAWTSPMKPTGTDGFGVYWIVKEDEFRNGKANYIIHKADIKEQCGKDIAWFPKLQGKQVFVNSGDCNTYYSADEAIKARK